MRAGEVLEGRFEIERLAATGGMAQVYRARDIQGGLVAVKVAHSGKAHGERIEREAKLLAKLRHPAIVSYIATGRTKDGKPYLVMEWLDGVDLRHITDARALTLAESISLVRRIASALAFAHAQGTVHRDLKPSNVFLVGGAVENAKLIDFGIGRGHDLAELTLAGGPLGTVGYMAPEQAKGQGADERADVYALGALFFHCLASRPPLVATTAAAHAVQLVVDTTPHLHELLSDVPDDLDALVAAMLARSAEDRPSLAELAGKLDAIEANAHGVVLQRREIGVMERRQDFVERAPAGVRTLLGRATPCIGRDRELAFVAALLDECIDERRPRAVLIKGPPGVGKSRVAHELISRARQSATVWVTRAEANQTTPLFAIAQMLRRAASQGWGAFVSMYGVDARTAEFLGELVQNASDPPSLELEAARAEPALMGDQILRAWEVLVVAATMRPLVLIVDDVQWADAASMSLFDAAMVHAREAPLLVVMLGRPEAEIRGAAQTLRLEPLTKRASTSLVRAVLPDVDDVALARVVETAGGNAFYLEELVRAVAEGKGDRLPESVLAMGHARLETCTTEERRLLRAASVFGEVFWTKSLAKLVGSASPTALRRLVADEMIAPRSTSRFTGEEEYRFRHALLRDVAYTTLTQEDRTLAHRLAAEWLDAIGEHPLVVGEHFERAELPGRAAPYLARAARDALAAHDLPLALLLSERARRFGITGDQLVALHLLDAEAHAWRGENAAALESAMVARSLTSRSSESHLTATSEVIAILVRTGDARVSALMQELAEKDVDPRMEVAYARAGARALMGLMHDVPGAQKLEARIQTLDVDLDGLTLARLHVVRAVRASRRKDIEGRIEEVHAAAAAFDTIGATRWATLARANLAAFYAEAGDYDTAERMHEICTRDALKYGLDQVIAFANAYLPNALLAQGKLDRAKAVSEELLLTLDRMDARDVAARIRVALAHAFVGLGDIERAVVEAERVIASGAPPAQAGAAAAISRAHSHANEHDAALEWARRAVSAIRPDSVDLDDIAVRMVLVRALRSAKAHDEAAAAHAQVRAELDERASRITSTPLREQFLSIPLHVEIRS